MAVKLAFAGVLSGKLMVKLRGSIESFDVRAEGIRVVL